MLKSVQIVILVALILGIKGGLDAADTFNSTGTFHPGTLNKVATALLVVSFVLLVIFTSITYLNLHHAEVGEKRLFAAVALSLPSLLVRLVYSCFSTFSTKSEFNLLNGNTTVLLCVALIEEMIVVGIFEVMGLSLRKEVRERHVEGGYATQIGSADSNTSMQGQKQHQQHSSSYSGGERQQRIESAGDSTFMRIAKKTIIGRLVMAAVPDKGGDVEMQKGYVQRR